MLVVRSGHIRESRLQEILGYHRKETHSASREFTLEYYVSAAFAKRRGRLIDGKSFVLSDVVLSSVLKSQNNDIVGTANLLWEEIYRSFTVIKVVQF
jgi:hypothetical protein